MMADARDSRSAILAVLAATAAAGLLVVLPIYTRVQGDRTTYATLIDVNGRWSILPVLLPVAFTGLPLIIEARLIRVAATLLLISFVLLSAFSIGLFYVPAAALMVLSIRPRRTF